MIDSIDKFERQLTGLLDRPELFRAWLADRPANRMVGQAGHADLHPVARWLWDVARWDARVYPTKIIVAVPHSIHPRTRAYVALRTDGWLRAFTERLAVLHDSPLTAERAVEELDVALGRRLPSVRGGSDEG